MNDSRASGMAPLESLGLSPTVRTQLSQSILGKEKSDDQKNSHGELPRYMNRHESRHFQKHDDERAQLHISIFFLPELDPPQRHLVVSRNSVLLRNRRERGITGENA